MYYDIVTLSEEIDYISEYRDLKIRILNGENLFKINKHKIKQHKNMLDFISSKLPGDIITGSLSLSIYGMINRDIGDIDILIKDSQRYSSYKKYGYGDDDIENRLGYKFFKYKPSFFTRSKYYDVDFFLDKGCLYEEFNYNGFNLKVHNPLEIISHKIKMIKNKKTSSSKHSGDLYRIFNGVLD